jgi:molecular chaperone GrpE
MADADNIRKRAVKDRSELLKYQGEQIISDLLTVVDDFELALANSGTELDKFRQGVEMIHKRFLDVLGKWDVRGESAIGKLFDPTRHEALSKIASADFESGKVVNELKKAFFYKDKLIRPGQVVVAE